MRGASDTAFPVTALLWMSGTSGELSLSVSAVLLSGGVFFIGNAVFPRLDADARPWLKVRTSEAPSTVAETITGGTVLVTSSLVKSTTQLLVFAAAQARYPPDRNMEGGGGRSGSAVGSTGIRESATVSRPGTAGRGKVRERAVSCRKWLNSAGGRSETVRRLRRPLAQPLQWAMLAEQGRQTPAAATGSRRHTAWYRIAAPLAGSVAITRSLACSQVGRSGNDRMGR